MRAKITAISLAAIIAAVIGAGPSFGQAMSPAGSAPAGAAPPAAAAPAGPAGGGGGPAASPRSGGGAPAMAPSAGRGGNYAGRAPMAGGSGRQWSGGGSGRNWSGRRHYRGYAGPVYGGFWGGPYAYDDGYYVEGPVAAGGDVAYCMRRFRSYDPGSGTYLGNDGYRHACP